MRKYLNHVAIAALAFVVGCSAYTEPGKNYAKTESAMTEVKGIRNTPLRYHSGEVYQRIFVEQLKEVDADKPKWFFKKKQINVSDVPLQAALSNIFYDEPLQFRFLDGIDLSRKVTLSSNGSLGQALDSVANVTGYSYTIEKDVVTWSKFAIANFDINMFPGGESFGIGKNGGGAGAGNSTSFSTIEQMKSNVINSQDEYIHLEGDIDVVGDVQKMLGTVKSKEGSILVNRSSMTVQVNDYPTNIAKMQRIMNDYNEQLTRAVVIEMTIVNVELSNNYNFGLDWKLVGTELAGRGVDIGNTGNFTSSTAAAAIDSPIFTISRTAGQFSGTQMLMQALESQGSVSNKTLPRATTLNNRAVKLRDIQRTNFLLERTITTTANVGTEGSVKQGTVETGFSLYAIPKIANGDVIVRLTTNISTLLGLDKKSSSSSSTGSNTSSQEVYVEAPRVNDKDFDNTVVIKNGDTLVLAGLTSESSTSNEANAGSDILGTAKSADGKRVETLILITPTILRGR